MDPKALSIMRMAVVIYDDAITRLMRSRDELASLIEASEQGSLLDPEAPRTRLAERRDERGSVTDSEWFPWNAAQHRWECRDGDRVVAWISGELVAADNRSMGVWLARNFGLGLMP